MTVQFVYLICVTNLFLFIVQQFIVFKYVGQTNLVLKKSLPTIVFQNTFLIRETFYWIREKNLLR